MPIKTRYLKIDNYDYVGREQRPRMKMSVCIINEMSTEHTIYSYVKLFRGVGLVVIAQRLLQGELVAFQWKLIENSTQALIIMGNGSF